MVAVCGSTARGDDGNARAVNDRPGNILVTQLGARRHYLVPVAFEQAGVLQRFVTDFYSKALAGGLASTLPSRMSSRLRSRRTADLPPTKVSSFPRLALTNAIRSTLEGNPGSSSRRWIRSGARFASLCRQHLSRETTHVFAFTSAAHELFVEAKGRGVRCVLDHATAPRRNEMALVQEEQDRFPEWGAVQHGDTSIDAYHERQLEEARLADVVVCNSTFARGVLESEGVPPQKIAVVPLGIRLPSPNSVRDASSRRGGRLRVLYVGAEALRKGVPYLVQALNLLGSSQIEARFVGNLGLSQHGLAEVQRVGETKGTVPRSEMDSHFAWADVLVLPSISDTFGLVILEAMARGVPVIASENTGGPDVVREDVDGFVVRMRDGEAIARRLDELASDHARLAEMSRAAAQRVQSFSLDAYRERIVAASGMRSSRRIAN